MAVFQRTEENSIRKYFVILTLISMNLMNAKCDCSGHVNI